MELGHSAGDSCAKVTAALAVSRLIWPDFVEEHGCVLLARHAGANPPPNGDTATGWESFVNHTHVLDEFANDATARVADEVVYDEHHPDFIAACQLGQHIAKMWALKLKIDFPSARFRVYYTQYDNPIVRFHKVREDELHWLSDDDLQAARYTSLRSAVVHDTSGLSLPGLSRSEMIH